MVGQVRVRHINLPVCRGWIEANGPASRGLSYHFSRNLDETNDPSPEAAQLTSQLSLHRSYPTWIRCHSASRVHGRTVHTAVPYTWLSAATPYACCSTQYHITTWSLQGTGKFEVTRPVAATGHRSPFSSSTVCTVSLLCNIGSLPGTRGPFCLHHPSRGTSESVPTEQPHPVPPP